MHFSVEKIKFAIEELISEENGVILEFFIILVVKWGYLSHIHA